MSTPQRVTGIVLAGGRSTRFGGDKLAVEIGGRPLLHRAIVAVARSSTRSWSSWARMRAGARRCRPTLPVPVVVARDAVAGQGPLARARRGPRGRRPPARAPRRRRPAGAAARRSCAELLARLRAGCRGAAARRRRPRRRTGGSGRCPVALRVATVRPAAEVALDGGERAASSGCFGRLRVGTLARGRLARARPGGRLAARRRHARRPAAGLMRGAILAASSVLVSALEPFGVAADPSPGGPRVSTTVHLLTAGYAGDRVASSVTLVRGWRRPDRGRPGDGRQPEPDPRPAGRAGRGAGGRDPRLPLPPPPRPHDQRGPLPERRGRRLLGPLPRRRVARPRRRRVPAWRRTRPSG